MLCILKTLLLANNLHLSITFPTFHLPLPLHSDEYMLPIFQVMVVTAKKQNVKHPSFVEGICFKVVIISILHYTIVNLDKGLCNPFY